MEFDPPNTDESAFEFNDDEGTQRIDDASRWQPELS